MCKVWTKYLFNQHIELYGLTRALKGQKLTKPNQEESAKSKRSTDQYQYTADLKKLGFCFDSR
jgi:hypothetical protein